MEANLVNLEAAWKWLEQGGRLLVGSPVKMLVLLLAWALVAISLAIPIYSIPLIPLLWSVFYAGLFCFLDAQARGQGARLSALGRPFAIPGVTLRLLGLSGLTVGLYLFLIIAALTMVYGSKFAMESTPGLWDHIGAVIIVLSGLVSLIFFVFIQLLCVFATPLVVFQNAAPIDAMAGSFRACSKNWQAFLVFGLVLAVVLIAIAILLLFLGWVAINSLKANVPLAAIATVAPVWERTDFLTGAGVLTFVLLAPTLGVVLGAVYASYRHLFDSEPASVQ